MTDRRELWCRWYRENRERHLQKNREWYLRNRERVLEKLRERWQSDPEYRCGASCSRDENAARVLWRWMEEQLCGREPAEAWRAVRPNCPSGSPARP